MDRAMVARLPSWERALLQRWGVAMLRSQPTIYSGSEPQAAASTQQDWSREQVLTMTADEMGLA